MHRCQILIFLLLIALCLPVHASETRVEMKTNLGSIVLELYPEKSTENRREFPAIC